MLKLRSWIFIIFVPLSPAVRPSVHLSGQILLPWYLMNGLSNLQETYGEFPLSSTPLLITRLDSGHQRSRPLRWWRHPRRRWSVKAHLLIVQWNIVVATAHARSIKDQDCLNVSVGYFRCRMPFMVANRHFLCADGRQQYYSKPVFHCRRSVAITVWNHC